LFVQDRITVRDRLTLEVGMRYEWHVTPTERDNRFVVFDAASVSLIRVGVDVDQIYGQNARKLRTPCGVAWQLSGDGRTVLRAAYARAADEPERLR
jgi:outer membrane receptor protein involved in Fe transport